jgi:hypothetical protein
LNQTLGGEDGAKLVIEGTVAGTAISNFKKSDGTAGFSDASEIKGTFEWKDGGWVAEAAEEE